MQDKASIVWEHSISRGPKVFNSIACGRDIDGKALYLVCEANGWRPDPKAQEGRWVCLVRVKPGEADVWEELTPLQERWKPVSGHVEQSWNGRRYIVGTIAGLDGQGDKGMAVDVGAWI